VAPEFAAPAEAPVDCGSALREAAWLGRSFRGGFAAPPVVGPVDGAETPVGWDVARGAADDFPPAARGGFAAPPVVGPANGAETPAGWDVVRGAADDFPPPAKEAAGADAGRGGGSVARAGRRAWTEVPGGGIAGLINEFATTGVVWPEEPKAGGGGGGVILATTGRARTAAGGWGTLAAPEVMTGRERTLCEVGWTPAGAPLARTEATALTGTATAAAATGCAETNVLRGTAVTAPATDWLT
jgi:hypothetical protein